MRKGYFLLGCLIALAVLGGCGTAAPPETAEAAPVSEETNTSTETADEAQPAAEEEGESV